MINDEQKYKKLCNFCDKILLSSSGNHLDAFVHNSWLHIINEHPNFLKPYHYLFSNISHINIVTLFCKFISFPAMYRYILL